jgi:ureidoglycolate hydrolase
LPKGSNRPLDMETGSMPKVVEISLQPLIPDAFASFGQILGDFDAPPIFEAPHLRSWRLDFELDGAAELMVARYLHQPFEFTAIERHFDVTQSFIPLGDQPSVMVVATPTDPQDWSAVPEPDALRAFHIPGDRGIMLWRGTWHALTRFPVRPEGAAFALITGYDTQRELEREKADGTPPTLTQAVDYQERGDLRFEVTDPDRLLGSM